MNSLLGGSARLIDGTTGQELAGAELMEAVSGRREVLDTLAPGIIFLRMQASTAGVLRYLAALRSRRAVALLDPGLSSHVLLDFVKRYEPGVVLGTDWEPRRGSIPHDYRTVDAGPLGPAWERVPPATDMPHPDIAVLLATSGSTGNPKFVRLSRTGVTANAASIIQALGITSADRTITSLPLHYSYGMSVLNTHLVAGAAVVAMDSNLLSRAFWDAVDHHGVTSLALVPSQYAMLRRIRFDPSHHPTLRTLTQAGGRMSTELIADFAERMAQVGGSLFVMYGTTEGGPRLTTLPAERLAEKLGSVGPAVAGGRLSIRDATGNEHTQPGTVGEVVYRGANVMMGYAYGREDLARGDDLGGVLATGDLGHLDAEGFLTIDGRISRFAKVSGVRVSLDDVERLFESAGPVAAVAGDDRVVVYAQAGQGLDAASLVRQVADALRLHWSGFETRTVEQLPLLANGKVDYARLGAGL